jgi:uncharacterized protein YggE
MRIIVLAIILGLAPGLLAAEETMRRMTLTGIGKVFVVPDMATISLGVSSFDKKASVAMRTNSSAMAQVFGKLKEAGVEERDIQTSQLSLNPRWERQSSNKQPHITGYEAINTVTVRVRALDSVGTVLDVLTQAGANRINRISFGIQKPRPHQDEARKRAVADARSKAELYAQAAGVTLGSIISISENGVAPQPRAMARMEMDSMGGGGAAVPVSKGELGLQAHITIVYEIK